MRLTKQIADIMYQADATVLPKHKVFLGDDFLADIDPRRVQLFAELIIANTLATPKNQALGRANRTTIK